MPIGLLSVYFYSASLVFIVLLIDNTNKIVVDTDQALSLSQVLQ